MMEQAIQVKELSKSYGSLSALKSLTLSVGRGSVFGLLGANGAGKSTAIECMLGTRRPDGGTVRILGKDPRSERKKLFQRVGVQFQETACQEKITVRELCEVTASLYQGPDDFHRLLAEFGLEGKEKNLVADLSGGEQQRLFIVLALIPRPEVVFLDELTTGLDARARRDVWKMLSALKAEGLTVLKHGRAVFTGTTAEAVAASPFETFEDAYLWFTEEEK